jgi:hypothetical protein
MSETARNDVLVTAELVGYHLEAFGSDDPASRASNG